MAELSSPTSLQRAYTRGPFGQMHYMAGGPEDSGRPPLVLLHQNPSSFVEYDNFAVEMAKDRRVIAFDTPGYGMSDPPPAPQSIAGYAGAFAAALDALGAASWGKADVFGYHTGSYLALELARQRPDLVGRAIVSGLPFRTPEQRAERLQAAQNPPPLTDDGAGIMEKILWMWDFVVRNRQPGVPIERAVEVFAEKIRPMHRTSWAYVGVWSYEAEVRLPQITQPVLILQPDEPLLEFSRAAAALIPDARFVEMPELSQDVFEVGVEAFAREIRGWDAAPR